MAKNKRPAIFSVTKAVKANARARLGTPPPSSPIPDRKTKGEYGPEKHKLSGEQVIERARQQEVQ